MPPASPLPQVVSLIAGECAPSVGNETFETLDPETDQPLATVTVASDETVEQAVQAASEAFKQFRNAPPASRERLLLTAAEVLEERRDVLIERLVREIGSPIGKANLEFNIALQTLRASAGIARRVTGRTYSADTPMSSGGGSEWSFAMRVPLGVTLAITPFNVPLIKAIKHTAMAWATGNTVVWLPSDQTAWIADAIGQVFAEAIARCDCPGGLFNIIQGPGSKIGDALVSHPLVRAVGFTGSTAVGRHVHATCGRNGKRVTLEMGGRNPLIVLADADLPAAVQAAVRGAFLFQGQICMATNRVIVEESIAEPFTESFVHAASQLSLGALGEPTTMLGPIINETSRRRIREHLEDAINGGASVLCGNTWQGNRLNPTILHGVRSSMRLAREETFGPVVSLEIAHDESRAIELANAQVPEAKGPEVQVPEAQGPGMLAASVFTRRIDAALRLTESLPTSMVHINDMTIRQQAEVPFGGEGGSGFGREGLETGVDDFTSWKWVTIR